jgi:hypothetical protein
MAIAWRTKHPRQLLVYCFQSTVPSQGVLHHNQPTLTHLVNIAFIIGILVVALSLVDFLLTDDQKKTIDGHILDPPPKIGRVHTAMLDR